MKIIITIFLFVVLLAFLCFLIIAGVLFKTVMDRKSPLFEKYIHGAVNTDLEAEHEDHITQTEAKQLAIGTAFWEKPTEKCYIESFDQLTLHGRIFMASEPSTKWLLCFHGYRTDGKTDMGYIASRMTQEGYNCLVVDQRSHGESQGDYIGMGWLERKDVIRWTEYLLDKKNPSEIFWVGDSMGAATILMASGGQPPDKVTGIIADCGYTSVQALFEFLLTNAFHLPKWLPIIPLFSWFTKLKLGFRVKEASAYQQLQHNHLPILFIHGEADNFVPTFMSKENMQATKGPKELILVKDAPHFSSIVYDPDLYFATIRSFLANYSKP